MRLEHWLEENDERQLAFAKRAGIHQSVVSRLCNGGDARGPVWARIGLATKGSVQPSDHFPPPRKRRVRGQG